MKKGGGQDNKWYCVPLFLWQLKMRQRLIFVIQWRGIATEQTIIVICLSPFWCPILRFCVRESLPSFASICQQMRQSIFALFCPYLSSLKSLATLCLQMRRGIFALLGPYLSSYASLCKETHQSIFAFFCPYLSFLPPLANNASKHLCPLLN